VPEVVSQQLLLPEGAAGQAFWQSLSDVQLEGQAPPPPLPLPPELEVALLLLLNPLVAGAVELQPTIATTAERTARRVPKTMPVCSDETRLMARTPRRG
jgi:hypothetical protein